MSTPENNVPKKDESKNNKVVQPPETSEEGGDEVGYCKPPKQHQFQKGNTMGKGRKPGSKGLRPTVTKEFGKKVATKENGKVVKKTKTEAGITQIANKFASGDPKFTDKALGLLERYGPQDEPEGPPPTKLAKDFKSLKKWLAMQELLHPQNEGGDHDQA